MPPGAQPSQIAALLGAGIETLDLQQRVTFQRYSRTVLPLDGYVFWTPSGKIEVPGALHHMMEMIQNEDETIGLASVFFTTQEPVTEFADVPINTIYVARQGEFRYTFSRHAGYFQAAQTWHYQGHSVHPAMASQLLDTPGVLDPSRVVVSNSLPIWLSMNGYTSPFTGGFSNGLTLYPSQAVPANLPPPYGSVHIGDDWTRALQSVPQVRMIQMQLTSPVLDQDGNPVLDQNGIQIVVPVFGNPGGLIPLVDQSGKKVLDAQGREILVPSVASNSFPVTVPKRVSHQLMADRVRIVLYGLQNDEALDFYASVLEIMNTQPGIGLMNMPAMRDGKRQQVELQALAMQKIIEFEVSYQQHYARDVALQLIQSASVTLLIGSA